MSHPLAKWAGYYLLEGTPCEITLDADGVPAAFAYISGKGLQPTSIWDVAFEAEPISKEQFTSLIIENVKA
jgi:hypothetical protein